MRLWDVAMQRMVQSIHWGPNNPTRGSFTPDGRHAVWAGEGMIRMYRQSASDLAKTDKPAPSPRPAAATP